MNIETWLADYLKKCKLDLIMLVIVYVLRNETLQTGLNGSGLTPKLLLNVLLIWQWVIQNEWAKILENGAHLTCLLSLLMVHVGCWIMKRLRMCCVSRGVWIVFSPVLFSSVCFEKCFFSRLPCHRQHSDNWHVDKILFVR